MLKYPKRVPRPGLDASARPGHDLRLAFALGVAVAMGGAGLIPEPARAQAPAPEPAVSSADNASTTDRCLSVAEVHDRDGDFSRNAAALASPNLCIMQETFREGPLTWRLEIVRNKTSPHSYFWFVPHDNENVAFDTAIYGVTAYGGTVVAVDTGGSRFNGPQDPNRNFDAGTGRKCPQQVAASPLYTAAVMKWRGGAPVIALHSNERGFGGDGHGGAGGISILRPLPGNVPYPAAQPLQTRSPSDSVVFVASTGGEGALGSLIAAFNSAGLNVIREQVSAGNNDCSLSNYMALTGSGKYINLEVVHGDGAGQRKMLNAALPIWSGGGGGSGGAAAEAGAPAAAAKKRVAGGATTLAKPARKKQAGVKPLGSKPLGSKPLVAKPLVSKPSVSKPSVSKPPPGKPATKPLGSKSSTSKSSARPPAGQPVVLPSAEPAAKPN